MTTRFAAKFAGLRLIAGFSMLIAVSAASADEVAAPQIEYGASLLCQTPEQAERLVANLDSDMGLVLRKVNAGVQVPACQTVPVAYARGQTLAALRSTEATFHMVRVLVVGVGSPDDFRAVAPGVFVALVEVKEFAV